jgi:hypothetical protein
VVAGVKWNVAHTVVIGGHLNWSLTHRGLTALTPTLALEYAFRPRRHGMPQRTQTIQATEEHRRTQ